MKSFFITIFLLNVLIQIECQIRIARCGRLGLNNFIPFLTNSNRANHHWPWHAALYHKYDNDDPIYQCGGSLISSKSVLTAGHCVSIDNVELDAKQVSVLLGRLNLDAKESSGQSFKVSEIFVHPNYNSIDYVNDIAIVRLSADATFNNYVQPICLWKSNPTDVSDILGRVGTVVGWGLTEKGEVSKVLRQASLPVVGFYACLRSNPDVFGRLLSETNFCAGIRNGTSVCTGDSGGSMTFEDNGIYYIRGIVSVGPSRANPITNVLECDSMQYAIFTDVAQYISWVKDTATIKECIKMVECGYRRMSSTCFVELNIEPPEAKCKIIFDNTYSNDDIWFTGRADSIPDLSDTIEKFENLKILRLEDMKLKTVDRERLTDFKKIHTLSLHSNEISQLDVDTFDDLTKLSKLILGSNHLKELHPDVFKELVNLEVLWLNDNRLEILPRGLLRNNDKLTHIFLEDNKLKEIATDFDHMPQLKKLNLKGNVCLDVECDSENFCELSTIALTITAIQQKC